jgi:hypothetical protein
VLRTIGGIVAGLVAWTAVATVLNLALRLAWPEYQAVEKAMAFTLGMMLARLALGALCTLSAGFAAALLSRKAVIWVAGLLLVIFVPVHYSLWDRFPAWYHLTFLISLPLLTLAGGALFQRKA